VGDALDHGHIVADEEEGEPEVGLEVHHQVEDLRLTETSRAETASSAMMSLGSSASARAMGDALALAAGKLVGEAAQEGAGQLHAVEEVRDAVLEFGAAGDARSSA
jgi:hypothetical protein